jgi:hypothetical protein
MKLFVDQVRINEQRALNAGMARLNIRGIHGC